MAQTYDTFWQQKYVRSLEEKMQHEAAVVCAGQCTLDEYRQRTGIIRGLQMAIDAVTELNDEIHKAEQGKK